jgi:hypothetical protein
MRLRLRALARLAAKRNAVRASQAPQSQPCTQARQNRGIAIRIESALIALELGEECLDAFATRRGSQRLTRCFTVERGYGLVGPGRDRSRASDTPTSTPRSN